MKAGDLVRYVRALPCEAHHVYQVQEATRDHDGDWVLLVECADGVDLCDEVAPGIMGGFGAWEEAKEFALVEVHDDA